MYKYSTRWEVFVLWCGLIGSFISGFISPGFGYVIGKVILMFDPMLTLEESRAILHEVAYIIFGIAFFQLIFGWIGYACL